MPGQQSEYYSEFLCDKDSSSEIRKQFEFLIHTLHIQKGRQSVDLFTTNKLTPVRLSILFLKNVVPFLKNSASKRVLPVFILQNAKICERKSFQLMSTALWHLWN